MREQKRILVAAIWADPNDPRKHHDEAKDRARGENMLAIGQQMPILVHQEGDKTIVIDGHGRVRSAKLMGIAELDAIVWPGRPTANEILLAQLGIDFHRSNFSAMDRSNSLHRAKQALGCSVNDLAAMVNIGQPLCTKYLAMQRLCAEARNALHEHTIDVERAYVVSQEPDPVKQLELLKAATECSRDQLRRRARGVTTEPKVASARFIMPGGVIVGLQGRDVTLSLAIEVLSETVRMLKKSQNQRLDISTVERVCKDKAKAGAK